MNKMFIILTVLFLIYCLVLIINPDLISFRPRRYNDIYPYIMSIVSIASIIYFLNKEREEKEKEKRNQEYKKRLKKADDTIRKYRN